MTDVGDITGLLRRVSAGDGDAETALIARVYQDLLRLARYHLRKERGEHTLQATALVNEAYLKLVGRATLNFQDRAHFFRLAARVMRRILVDHARHKRTEKRGGGGARVELSDTIAISPAQSEQILDLDQALLRLHAFDPRQSQIVEMRFFAGLSEEEIASSLGISTRTVKREWSVARAWLRREIDGPSPSV